MSLKVMLAPSFEGNQYLDILESHLQDRGIVTVRETHSHPLWPLVFSASSENIDILHLHWTHPYFLLGDHSDNWYGPLAGMFSAVFALFFVTQVYLCSLLCSQVIWTVHNRVNHEKRYELLDRWVSRRLVEIVDAVQVWDEGTKREFEEYLGITINEVAKIPHGNYDPLYSTKQDSRSIEEKLNIDPDKRTFLYFGRIRPYKQVPKLIQVWKNLDPSDAQLVVAGSSKDDGLTQEIRSIGESRDDIVLDLRYIPDEDVPKYFAASDVAVFPYRDIFNSGSVLLAMTLGRAFVAPRIGAIPSVDTGENLIYDPNTGLETALGEALQKPQSELDAIGERNRNAALERYDWDEITPKIIDLYEGKNRQDHR